MKAKPLVQRLRDEADLWAKNEPARDLLLEAAAALERIVDEITKRITEAGRT